MVAIHGLLISQLLTMGCHQRIVSITAARV